MAVAGCANGVGAVDEDMSAVATFPAASPSAAGAPAAEELTSEASVDFDGKSELASLSSLGPLSLSISQNKIAGADLPVVRHITATLATMDGKIPELLASDVDVPEGSAEVALPLLIDDKVLLEYLTEGQVVVHLVLTGPLSRNPMKLTYSLSARVNVAVKRSVL
jgi:hypothetical protein